MKSDEAYVRHVLLEIDYLLARSQNLTYAEFLKDDTLQRAFARSFEIIGEAGKNLSAKFKERHKEIDWRAITGMRDILIHRYFEVDWEIVWKVMKQDLPGLKLAIERVLAEFKR